MSFFSILIQLPIIIISLTIHEFAHAYMANKLGDDTAKLEGRLSLNPLRHLDPIGLLAMIFVGFGWAKPVPINIYNFKNPIKDEFFVAMAGPISNLIQAICAFTLLIIINLFNFVFVKYISLILVLYIFTNIILCVFNFLPIPPLDGFSLLKFLSPKEWLNYFFNLEKYSILFFILMVIPNSPLQVLIGFILNNILFLINFALNHFSGMNSQTLDFIQNAIS